ncbi:MAG: integrase core domain-containing protein [Kofleriaceae bacterium]
MMKRLANGERLTDLCREYGISRKTGNKVKKRFDELGITGLADKSRAPKVIPHKSSRELVELVVAERNKHPTWGPKKIKEVLERRLGNKLPSISTVGCVLLRNGLVTPRKVRLRHKSTTAMTLRPALVPNDVWCIDYKGQFRLGDGTYCYPLTITDQCSRFILGCEGMGAISDEEAREVCESIFRTFGLPLAMRSDNGVPFSSVGLGGLTKLSAYWLRLGIALERIRPAHPEENGQHERMHRTLKAETTRPAKTNLLQQQERFDAFVDEFNQERPHEAINMKFPADVFVPSSRAHPKNLPELDYPTHDDVVVVNRYGHLRFGGRQVQLTSALAGQPVGVREEMDGRWLVSFASLDLGHVERDRTFTPINPSVPPDAN